MKKRLFLIAICIVVLVSFIVLWCRKKPTHISDTRLSLEEIVDKFFERISQMDIHEKEVIELTTYRFDDQYFFHFVFLYTEDKTEGNVVFLFDEAGDCNRWINLNEDDLGDMKYIKDAFEYAVEHGDCKTLSEDELEKYYVKYPLLLKAGASGK